MARRPMFSSQVVFKEAPFVGLTCFQGNPPYRWSGLAWACHRTDYRRERKRYTRLVWVWGRESYTRLLCQTGGPFIGNHGYAFNARLSLTLCPSSASVCLPARCFHPDHAVHPHSPSSGNSSSCLYSGLLRLTIRPQLNCSNKTHHCR